SRLACASVALNVARARCWARLIDAGVGWRSSWAAIVCRAIGPAFGLPADWRTARSNHAISLVQGPACAGALLRDTVAATKATVICWIMIHSDVKDSLPAVL